MRLMIVTNNPEYKYDQYTKSGWNLLPSLFRKRGIEFLGIGKYDLHKFYSKYLEFKPDLIIVEWIPASLIPLFFKKIRFVKCPITLNWGDYYAEMMDNNLKHPRFLVKFLENYVAKNVDFITTVSRYNEKKARQIGKPVFYIPHGYFKTNKKTKVNLNKLKTKKNNLKIIYLGEQSVWKKVDQIIKAVEGIDCDLFLFGKVNPEFENFASKNVHFMGYLDEMEVMPVLKQADILVNTSNQDCNYKFFEYISIGKPILAYDGLPTNILTHKKNAFLTKDFRKGLKELIENPQLRKSIENNIKSLKTYSWNEIVKQYVDLYQKFIDKTKNN